MELKAIQEKIQRRIKASRIFAYTRFRDHYSTCPGRHSWDLCGHPVYYWKLRAMADSKYIEKIIIWTEIEDAWITAKEMSDKFVIIKRSLEECREPEWRIVDDLKRPSSRVPINAFIKAPEKMKEFLDFDPTLMVQFGVDVPLETCADVNALIEKYFEDDIAEAVYLVYRIDPFLWIKDPEDPQYLMPLVKFFHTRRRQNYPVIYRQTGTNIRSYQWTGIQRTAYVEIPEERGLEVHNKKHLSLARFYLQKRLQLQNRKGSANE